MTIYPQTAGGPLPVVLPEKDTGLEAFVRYFRTHATKFEEVLRTTGSLKFTGVRLSNPDDFRQVVDAISDRFLNYIDGNSPRTKLSDHVYTSTEFDRTQRITMHNELSYSAKWPGKLFFSCLQPAETGGETLLADSRAILRAMDGGIVREITRRGIRYIRNLHGGTGIGPSWQETFETADKARLEEYCRSYGIVFEWKNDALRLIQASGGIIHHRITGEAVWFNQIDQFHPSHLDEELYQTMQLMYDSPKDFPMYVEFGDGSPIDPAVVKEIIDTIDRVTVAPVWERNQLLIIDNELISHGRNPYTGKRTVLVAMSE